MAVTTIQVAPDVKARLEGLKRYAQESYNDVIIRLLDLALDTEPLSDEAIRGIEEALEDIRAGRVYPEEEMAREFGI